MTIKDNYKSKYMDIDVLTKKTLGFLDNPDISVESFSSIPKSNPKSTSDSSSAIPEPEDRVKDIVEQMNISDLIKEISADNRIPVDEKEKVQEEVGNLFKMYEQQFIKEMRKKLGY